MIAERREPSCVLLDTTTGVKAMRDLGTVRNVN